MYMNTMKSVVASVLVLNVIIVLLNKSGGETGL
jgi:hypothetical protein